MRASPKTTSTNAGNAFTRNTGMLIDCRNDVLALRPSNRRHDRIGHDFGSRNVVAERRIHRTAYEARLNQRDVDPAAADFASNAVRKSTQTELRARIDAHDAGFTGNRSDVDDRSASLCFHDRQDGVHQSRRTEQVNGDNTFPGHYRSNRRSTGWSRCRLS